MTREHPILFSSPMVKALLAGTSDRLWVKETFKTSDYSCDDEHQAGNHECSEHCKQTYVYYRATPRVGLRGDRAMVRLEPRTVTMYRVEWEYDGHEVNHGCEEDGWATSTEEKRRVRVKFFRNKGAAYKWAALRLIFAKRDKLATGIGDNGYPAGCALCDIEAAKLWRGAPDEAPSVACRYHDHDGKYFEQLRARLARWLRWRDSETKGTE